MMSVAYFQLVKQSNSMYMYMSVCGKSKRDGEKGREKEGKREREKYVTNLSISSELMNPGKRNMDIHCAFL